jgi:hypothetical protein
MQVVIEVTNPLAREQTMTRSEDKAKVVATKELLERDEDFDRSAVQSFVQAALEAEMTEATVGAGGCGGGLRRRPRSVESEVAEAWFSAATKLLVHFDPAPVTSITAALVFTPAVHDQPASNC